MIIFCVFFVRIPWNWKTLSGYLLASLIQLSWLCAGIFIVVSAMLPFYGFCTQFVVFTMDINKKWSNLNSAIIDQQNFTTKNRIEFIRRLIKLIEFHSVVKEYVKKKPI